EPRLIDDARHVADRNAEAQRAAEIEAVDVAQELRAVVGLRQELESRPEVRVRGARRILLAGGRTEPVAPQRDVLVNPRELRLCGEIDPIAGRRDQVVEAEASARGAAADLAVAGGRKIRKRAVEMDMEVVELHDPLERVERHGRDAPLAEQE